MQACAMEAPRCHPMTWQSIVAEGGDDFYFKDPDGHLLEVLSP